MVEKVKSKTDLNVNIASNKDCEELEQLEREKSTKERINRMVLKGSKEKIDSLNNHIKGLANLGNTCFFNAVMQCLSQTYYLVHNLSSHCDKGHKLFLYGISEPALHLDPIEITLGQGGPLVLALSDFIRNMHSSSNNKVVNPGHLFGVICQKSTQFRGGDQQDSHELLRHLLDELRREDNKRHKRAILHKFDLDEKVDPKIVPEDIKQKVKHYGNQVKHSFMDSVFSGLLISAVLCEECRVSSLTYESFMDLSLSISEEKGQRLHTEKKSSEVSLGCAETPGTKDRLNKSQLKKLKKQQKLQLKEKRRLQKLEATALISQEINKSVATEGNDDGSQHTDKSETSLDVDKVENPIEKFKEHQEEGCAPCVIEMKDSVLNSTSDADIEDNSDYGGGKDSDEDSSDSSKKVDVDTESLVANSTQCMIFEDGDMTNLCAEVQDLSINQSYNIDSDALDEKQSNGICREKSGGDDFQLRTKQEWMSRTWKTLGTRYQPSSHECSVQSCINQLTAPELLTGRNKFGCENCTRKMKMKLRDGGDDCKPTTVYSNASKRLLIYCPPAILTLHLKRFQQIGFRLRKVTRHVDFPFLLDLAPFCSSICMGLPSIQVNQKEILYSLYGIVEHSGRLSGGHYTAFVKVRPVQEDWARRDVFLNKTFPNVANIDSLIANIKKKSEFVETDANDALVPDGKWFHVSDSQVTEVSEARVLKAQAYLLYYERLV